MQVAFAKISSEIQKQVETRMWKMCGKHVENVNVENMLKIGFLIVFSYVV